MQIQELEITSLFGAFERSIPFGTHSEEEQALSLVLLHGPNGSGKTTSLRMIDGMMTLNFDVHRAIPFGRCVLRFSTGEEISVTQDAPAAPLQVEFGEFCLQLHPKQSGPLEPTDAKVVDEFRQTFFAVTQKISFEYIHTWRQTPSGFLDEEQYERDLFIDHYAHSVRSPSRRRLKHPGSHLADRVAKFIAEAQVDYRRFFRSNEPDFLSAIIQRLQAGTRPETTASNLLNRLSTVRGQEDAYERLGVERDRWDFDLARSFLEQLSDPASTEGLSVMTAAAEVLETRAREQKLLAERLLTFERTMNSYFRDKEIKVEPRKGFSITNVSGENLSEDSLGSGEYHLLYLMVAALTTQRRGTVLAIDEPELSMHISWQRRIIDSLRECSSNASPQLLLATHSPDIVGEYRDYLVPFGNTDELRRE
ncbi:AAA family ATPase [Candidatus Poriferisodalis sp.]|uniref:AAA family ATPase n=1 Tax=Candidatus Poriferisodalis sp. TaxID=3101277 RepID=UPI003D13B0D0